MQCGEVERVVFGDLEEDGQGSSVEKNVESEADDDDDDDDDDEGGGGVPLPLPSSASPSTPTPPLTTSNHPEKHLTPQQRGLLKAREREMVRQAARRGVAFGFEVYVGVEGGGGGGKVERRKVECVRGGRVVESSFAKGEWGVRWRV